MSERLEVRSGKLEAETRNEEQRAAQVRHSPRARLLLKALYAGK